MASETETRTPGLDCDVAIACDQRSGTAVPNGNLARGEQPIREGTFELGLERSGSQRCGGEWPTQKETVGIPTDANFPRNDAERITSAKAREVEVIECGVGRLIPPSR